ncbi:MAG: diacylglycerol kinase family protein, partial [Waterburya sp.]
MENLVIFEHQLAIFPEKPQHLGILTTDSLFWWHNGEKQQLALRDVVGVSLLNREKDKDPCLVVHAYPVVKTGYLGKKQQRVLKEYCFTCPDIEVRSRSVGYAQSQWQRAINNTLEGKPIDAIIQPRHLQIIINPVSGRGQTSKIFQQVLPLLDRSNLEYTVTETSSATDTKNLVLNLNLVNTDGIVIVGGDGTIHDAIAGLMSRPDWETAIKIPLGIIPGGTGNGLCKTILELAGESYDPLNAAFLIVKGKQQALDIAAVVQNDKKYYSCLSLAWGLVSDIDIESERLRFLGSLRFELYALMLICLM